MSSDPFPIWLPGWSPANHVWPGRMLSDDALSLTANCSLISAGIKIIWGKLPRTHILCSYTPVIWIGRQVWVGRRSYLPGLCATKCWCMWSGVDTAPSGSSPGSLTCLPSLTYFCLSFLGQGLSWVYHIYLCFPFTRLLCYCLVQRETGAEVGTLDWLVFTEGLCVLLKPFTSIKAFTPHGLVKLIQSPSPPL